MADVQHKAWTVGDLRKAIEFLEDTTAMIVHVRTTDTYGLPDGWLPISITGLAPRWGDERFPDRLELETDPGWHGVLLYVPTAEPGDDTGAP